MSGDGGSEIAISFGYEINANWIIDAWVHELMQKHGWDRKRARFFVFRCILNYTEAEANRNAAE
jgi:hypothetical protein